MDDTDPNGPAGERDVQLEAVESLVLDALISGDDSSLGVLGYGEISLVIGWPTQHPTAACKRLPPFRSVIEAEAYGELFTRYLDLLASRGVRVVPSEFRVQSNSGSTVAYVVQPVLEDRTLGPEVLRRSEPDPDHVLVVGIIDAVMSVCDDTTGLDAQVSNWALVGERLLYLDVTTPMTFDRRGLPLLDMGVFLAAYPWALRAPITRFVAPGVIGAYRDPRHVLVDLAANLIKEDLQPWLPAVVEAANRRLTYPVTIDEVTRFYRSDARMWELLARLRRADRWWQRNVRRRTYPFLLPGKVDR